MEGPGDLLEFSLSFLSKDDLLNVTKVNRRMNTFACSQLLFRYLITHPQRLQENSLSNRLMSAALLEQEPDRSLVTQYFNDRFRGNNLNLLTQYQAARNRLLEESWVHCEEEIKQLFYPEITQGWLQLEARALVHLAKTAIPAYRRILEKAEQSLLQLISADEDENVENIILKNLPLPPKQPIESYWNLKRFFDRVHFIEEIWSDMVLLNSILTGLVSWQRPNLNRRIIRSFNNVTMTENITPRAVLFICSLDNFRTELLIKNPNLFTYFNSLSPDALVFAVRHKGVRLDHHDLDFLKAVVRSAELRERLSGCHYVEMVSVEDAIHPEKTIVLAKAGVVILSVPEIIDKLTDEDLLILMRGAWKETPQLLQDNPALKKRMTGSVWSELAKESPHYREFVLNDEKIYKLLSTSQLSHIRKLNFIRPEPSYLSLPYLPPPSLPPITQQLQSSTRLPEEKHQPPEARHNRLEQSLKITLAVATTLLIAGTATGVATFLAPHLLAVTIGLLGAALLTFGAYGLIKCYSHGFFSSSAPASIPTPSRPTRGLRRSGTH